MPQANKDHRFKFTLSKIDNLEFPKSGQVIYHDTIVPSLALRVTPTKKSYLAIGRVSGRYCRVTLDEHGNLLPETARDAARAKVGEMAGGVNPIVKKKTAKKRAETEAKRQAHEKGITLSCVWQEYKQAKNLRPRTLELYEWILGRFFKDWMQIPIVEITKNAVQDEYKRQQTEGGRAAANLAMRLLRALMNYAIVVYENDQGESLLKANPVARLSQAKLWERLAARTSVIPVDELKNWYRAVMNLQNQNIRDMLLVTLWTGLRRGEVCKLKWTDIDLKRGTLKIRAENSKNHCENVLPLSTFLHDLLTNRSQVRDIRNPYVFPGSNRNKAGHMKEAKRRIADIKEATGIEFSMHDLRRTFISLAERLVPVYTLKRLVNHSLGSADITARYVIRSTDDLRDDVEKISVFLIEKTGAKIQANQIRTAGQQKVVALKARA